MTTKSVLDRATTNTQLDGVSADIGLLIIRVVFGALLAAHGTQKLFGWFWGYGMDATAGMFDGMGYNPGRFFGTLAGLSELAGGLLLALGLLTPLAGAIVVGTMINAINASWGPGLFGQGGWEIGLLFAVVGAGFAFTGAGRFSLDNGRPWHRQGFAVGAAAVALGVIAAVITLIFKWVL
ncbi:putative oxidoreductase [Nocardia tenerifensis]|uniref:Putative oxidoreductase n=1 Tax=Nocardia tenerifensis TaxID=228006 RepID=A0A318JXI0_9NOCA|nr:DoxX family protein [Nocardia tenerifensis]PXX61459.1 putative oxidoreductase [Nocardia tenerifensis]